MKKKQYSVCLPSSYLPLWAQCFNASIYFIGAGETVQVRGLPALPTLHVAHPGTIFSPMFNTLTANKNKTFEHRAKKQHHWCDSKGNMHLKKNGIELFYNIL